eukprot:CAMPEP_0181190294 /NCGR_PEP_ID=MMETSP1096-20121128/12115_1 /TAXON_ID=156174 ORGANISM="Chrysochromulina ericina, Strain CCMP281" /NCGR_SAMPLE_ID=MMETSP1096 /ASSEMBLY_ACC=CAM_ASM_000453 /LENGTH=54 /DNA_ID=CAMNT_0023279497 /DNA_START=265 /DNA_END=430 /DNA_ORIENTATION=+
MGFHNTLHLLGSGVLGLRLHQWAEGGQHDRSDPMIVREGEILTLELATLVKQLE